jgi:c(7)-type cytochrome triheme protein
MKITPTLTLTRQRGREVGCNDFIKLKEHFQMKTIIMATILVTAMMIGNAMAVQSGKTLGWDSPKGKVTFDGKVHADKGLKCNDCHTKIFKMKKGSTTMKMADLNVGKFCGECHNGTKAFKTDDSANCAKCHKK